MTNPSIPPCPVCGVVPEYQTDNNSALLVRDSEVMLRCCGWDGFRMSLVMWKNNCTEVLYGALRTHGIHTLQQLTERMSPDPRVAVLERVAKCAETYMDATAHCSGNQFYDDAALGLANAIIDMYNTQNQPAEE